MVMNNPPATASNPAGIARVNTLAFRWCWATLACVLAALYIGWGGLLPFGFLPLIPAWFLFRFSFKTAPRTDPLGKWNWVVTGMAVCCALGVLALPVEPSAAKLERHDRKDRESVEAAIERIRIEMDRAAVGAGAAISDRSPGLTEQQSLESFWPAVRKGLGDDAAAIGLFMGEGASYAWVGSPYMAAEGVPVTVLSGRAASDDIGQNFLVTGDRLAAIAHMVLPLEQGKLVVSVLLARAAAVPGPAPGVEPLLQRVLPVRIVKRLEIKAGDGGYEGAARIAVGGWTAETTPYPVRGIAQAVLLIAILCASLGLLVRDSSAVRGLIAAPLIYASAIPLLLGSTGRPLSIELVSPSWTGYQLTNQAFIAVAAAGLALWFAVHLRHRMAGYLEGKDGRLLATLLLVGVVILWVLGFGLLHDLYRFAPTWFWARVSFLPAVKDLLGWLIAIAMTLTVIGGTGGVAALLMHRYGLAGILVCAVSAVIGGSAASIAGAWGGSVFVGAAAAVGGTVVAAVWLDRTARNSVLITLLGLALLGALVHLPIKGELGRVMVRRVVVESAESLRGTGVGVSPDQVTALSSRLRLTVSESVDEVFGGSLSSPGSHSRSAFMVWRNLGLDEQDLTGGVQVIDASGAVAGRFSTVPGLFEVSIIDSMIARVSHGEGRLALTAGTPAYFGEETLLMAVPGPDGVGSLMVGLRRRPLGFLAAGEDRLWMQPDPAGISERSGRLAGVLFVRVYDEAYRLLAMPRNPSPAPAPGSVPVPVVERLRAGGGSGVWFRRGWWVGGGADEYYFWLETPSVRPPVPGGEVSAVESVERRIACLGLLRPGLWGRIVEALNVLLLFIGTMLVLAWLPAAAVAGTGVPLSRSLRRVSFRTRLMIPLLVVALVPLVALWMLTRGFILNREEAAWEESLDRSLREVQRSILGQTEDWAEELARESEFGGAWLAGEQGGGTQWALFDANLVRYAGTLTDSLADRIPLRELRMGRGRRSFVFRSGSLWSAAVASVGPRFSRGAALIVRPFSEELLRQASEQSPWQVDLFEDGRLRYSTESAPYTAGLLAPMMPPEAGWEGSRGRDVGTFRWGELGGLRYLFSYRPLTDYSGIAVATIAQRRFGLWGLNDPDLERLFTTVASIYILLVVAVTLVALMVARRISNPVGSLTRSAGRVAGGDLEVNIPVTRGDEIGGLQKAFRQMVIALRENRLELARAERERAWQEMARQVAHEIKNPLTPMQLSAQFLRRAYDEGTDDLGRIVHECTDAIVEQVEGLRRIANEFSAYARLPTVRREPTDLNEPLEDALNLFEPALPAGIKVVRGLDGDLPEALLDSEQIRRVAINLIRNAIDAMGEEGTLTVKSGRDEQGVWLQVSDTGEGIAPEVQERLFEPYFSTKTDGTGLGLAITRAIVDAYGGSLTVDSRPGEGTTMTAHFPFE